MCVCVCVCVVCVCVYVHVLITQSCSHVQLFATPGTVAPQAPLFMEFSRQEYWSRLPFPFPGDLHDTGIERVSAALQADSLQTESQGRLT